MTTSAEDDKHAAAMEAAGGGINGLAIYGLYWVLAEMIGAQIRPEQITTRMTKTWKKWAEKCGIRPTFFQKRVKSMAVLGLIRLYCDEKVACIDMPNLVKYADEYIKRILKESGHTPESIGRLSSPPALPAYPDKQDLKKGPVDNSDNSPQNSGTKAADGGVFYAPPPHAPADRKPGKLDHLDLPGQMTAEELREAARSLGAKLKG